MAKSYLDIINDAREELSQGSIAVSRLVDTDAETKRARSALQQAVRDLYASHTSLPSESKVVTASTTSGQALLTNLTTNPWDGKMVKELHWFDTAENTRKRIVPVTQNRAEDFKLLTFQNTFPQYYYQTGNDIYLIPTPNATYTVYVRYNRSIPLISISDLTTTLDIDNEGILILTDLVTAHLRKGQDPEWKDYLKLAKDNAVIYYDRVNSGLKNQGINSIMRVRTNPADLNY